MELVPLGSLDKVLAQFGHFLRSSAKFQVGCRPLLRGVVWWSWLFLELWGVEGLDPILMLTNATITAHKHKTDVRADRSSNGGAGA